MLVAKLGLQPADLAEDTSVFQFEEELPTMSTEARRLARRWDSLPEHLRKWITETIENFEEISTVKQQRVSRPRRPSRR